MSQSFAQQPFLASALTPQFQCRIEPTVSSSLPASVQAQVDQIWESESQRLGPVLFDGKLFSAHTTSEHELVGSFVPYKHFVAQMVDPSLFEALQVQAVAVTGLTRQHGTQSLLIGQRAHSVTQHPGLYEVAPSGGVDAHSARDGVIDLQDQLLRELNEETGISASEVLSVVPYSLVYERDRAIWEVCFHVTVDDSAQITYPPQEYQNLFWVKQSQISEFKQTHQSKLVPLTEFLLDCLV